MYSFLLAAALVLQTVWGANEVENTTFDRKNLTPPPPLPGHGSPTITNLEDIEALSYFILYHHYFFRVDTSDANGDDSSFNHKYLNQTITEQNLHKFLEKLKYGKLLQGYSSPRDREQFNCEDLDSGYIAFLESSKGSILDRRQRQKVRALCEAAAKCQTASDMVQLIDSVSKSEDNSQKTSLSLSQTIVRLCPVMLFQLQDDSCTEQRQKNVKGMMTKMRPSTGAVWGFAILFVTIISFCSLVGVAIMPFLNQSSYHNVLNLFEGLAVGSLVGSAIFHLIPQAFDLLGKDSNQDYLWKALIIFGGIYLFFWSERIMKMVVTCRRRKKLTEMPLNSVTEASDVHKEDNHPVNRHVSFIEKPTTKISEDTHQSAPNGTTSALSPTSPMSPDINDEKFLLRSAPGIGNNNHLSIEKSTTSLNDRDRSRSNSFTPRHHHSHDHLQGDSKIATIAWMIIFGDGLHNFIDGLSIGAAFCESILAGISISVAVICEEFPHELGDFAVLIASGMSIRQAIGYNFLSACTCYLGMGFGILLGDSTQGSTYIFALAGGMFLYIALVDMMGELATALDEASQVSTRHTLKVLFLQNVGILVGVSTLFLLAKYSDHINFEGLAPPENRDNPLLGNAR